MRIMMSSSSTSLFTPSLSSFLNPSFPSLSNSPSPSFSSPSQPPLLSSFVPLWPSSQIRASDHGRVVARIIQLRLEYSICTQKSLQFYGLFNQTHPGKKGLFDVSFENTSKTPYYTSIHNLKCSGLCKSLGSMEHFLFWDFLRLYMRDFQSFSVMPPILRFSFQINSLARAYSSQ